MRLKQILINLVKNALKFTPVGIIKIIASYDEDQAKFNVHIVDNGKGIINEDLNMLFKMFGKLRRSAKMNHDGIGMGLMICQQLVQMNEGTIKVHSEGED